jgi:hypothetical protein
MATILKNAIIKDVGQLPIDAINVPVNRKVVIMGISLANTKDSTVLGSVMVKDAGSVVAYYAKDVPIPPNGSLRALNGSEKLVLDEYHTLQISSSYADSVDAVISYAEQT